ncbi:NB-ARC domain-containing protein [Frankia sp. QA3]|nr:NB-ARC domain-containing protein [Frankia sp. QA3]
MTGGGAAQGGWDFFVSYTQADRAWAEWVAWELEAAGFAVVLQAWDMLAGDHWPLRVDEAVRGSAHTVAVMSGDYLTSEWATVERLAALRADPLGRGRRLLPVRVADVRDDGLSGSVVDIDLFGVSEQVARERLVSAARLVCTGGRGRPASRPGFPPAAAGRRPGGARFPDAPPQVRRMPWPRNPNFVGRAAELALLRDRLTGGAGAVPVLPQALHGLGGVGKTQLAVEYAYRYARCYDLVWWLDAEKPGLLLAGLGELAGMLGGDAGGSVEQSAGRAVELLRRAEAYPAWLVIVDNAAGPDVLGALEVANGLLAAAGGDGHVLVTSRDGRWSSLAAPVEIDVLPPPEAAGLLRRRVPGLATAQADRLADVVDGLPLALEQAGAWLAETGMPAAEYERLLHSRVRELMAQGAPAGRVPVAATWTVTLHDLGDPAAVTLARLWARFGPEPIPVDLIGPHVADLLPGELAAVAADPVALAAVRGRLVRLAVVRVVGDAVVMHRLVQAVLRDDTPEGERAGFQAAAHRLLAAAHPDERTTPAGWARYARLYPHVLATGLVDADDGESRNMVIWTVWYLRQVGDYPGSLALARRTHEQWIAVLGKDHSDTLTAAAGLAGTLRAVGDYPAARRLEEDVLARRREILGEDHPDTLSAAANLAGTLWAVGDYPAARRLQEDVLARRREILGEDHPDTLTVAADLAGTLRATGDYPAARRLQEDVLVRSRETLGEDHPNTLTVAADLAGTLRATGDYPAARRLQEDVLVRSRETLGEDHPNTLTVAANLAVTLRATGDYPAARRLQEDVLVRSRETLGEDHPNTLTVAANLAVTLRATGDYPAARRLQEDVLARRRETLGEDHPDTRAARRALADSGSDDL